MQAYKKLHFYLVVSQIFTIRVRSFSSLHFQRCGYQSPKKSNAFLFFSVCFVIVENLSIFT